MTIVEIMQKVRTCAGDFPCALCEQMIFHYGTERARKAILEKQLLQPRKPHRKGAK